MVAEEQGDEIVAGGHGDVLVQVVEAGEGQGERSTAATDHVDNPDTSLRVTPRHLRDAELVVHPRGGNELAVLGCHPDDLG